MVGRFGFEFIHPDDLAAMSEDFSGHPVAQGVITNSYRVRRGDGDLRLDRGEDPRAARPGQR